MYNYLIFLINLDIEPLARECGPKGPLFMYTLDFTFLGKQLTQAPPNIDVSRLDDEKRRRFCVIKETQNVKIIINKEKIFLLNQISGSCDENKKKHDQKVLLSYRRR